MNSRIRRLSLLIAFVTASAGSAETVQQQLPSNGRWIERSLEAIPTASPIVLPKEEHHEEKPKHTPDASNHKKPPAPKPAPPAPQPAPKPAPATESSSSSGTGSGASSSSGKASGGGASGGGSGKTGSGGKHSAGHHSGPSHNKDQSNSSHGGAKKPLLLLIGAAASTLIIAGYTKAKRRKAVVQDHPLKGSIDRRMKLFGGLAGSKKRGTIDGELSEEDMSYKSADDYGITIV